MTGRSFAAGLALWAMAHAAFAAPDPLVLVYTKNGKGFVHDNIAASVKAIQELGAQNGFATEVSTNPAVFTDENLKRFKAVVFCNSNNEGFDTDAQREAFQRYIRGGGGFAGIHSATGTERKWPWYWQLIGGTFAWHHPLQPFTIRIAETNHPSTSFFPSNTWAWEDEFYYVKERNEKVHVLLLGDSSTVKKPGKKPADLPDAPTLYPLAWYHEFEGGRAWYTALGHKPEYYSDPLFRKHILGGIQWAMGFAPAGAGASR
jgi:uncharacterized protein